MHSTYNEGKPTVAERSVRTLKNKVDKHMTAISKSVYFDVLDDIVDEYNNTYHRTIKMKPVHIKYKNIFAECNEDFIKKDPKFKIGDHKRISKYIFVKEYSPIWSEEIFLIKKS